jgi:DNA-directed RNA polymerase subunit M/transcription elongation factor TFIIS
VRKENIMLEKCAAGDTVLSYCTKCKQGLHHTVVTMGGEAVLKVKCRTCGGTHKFRDPADIKKPRSSKKKEDMVKTAETLWEACLAEAKGRERVYDMMGRYRVGDVVLHNVFGKGVVRKTYLNKCDMLFKDKERLMASANQ